ncbi:MAG: hypothetical protein JJLCMIEE_01078 [Acidimicrobiales bacterium]|nr:hypothetical protein [Acidimicrobiales bacterium]
MAIAGIRTSSVGTKRLVAFTDAVFAIAITFLALGFTDIPASLSRITSDSEVQRFLADNVENFLVYAGTFLAVSYFWWRHHKMFRYIEQRDDRLVWLNQAALLVVAAMPYPSAVLGENLDLPLAVLLVSLPLTVIALLLLLMWEHSVTRELVRPGLSRTTVVHVRSLLAMTAAVFLLSSILAAVGVWLEIDRFATLAELSWALLVVGALIRKRRWPAEAPHEAADLGEQGADDQQPGAGGLASAVKRVRDGSDTVRIDGFVDGFYAIAVTLLALQLKPPAGAVSTSQLLDNLADQQWWTYVLSFWIISMFWYLHVDLHEKLLVADGVVLWLNLLHLMVVACVPFTTELVNRTGDTAAVILYAGSLMAASMLLGAVSVYALERRKLYGDQTSPLEIRQGLVSNIYANTVFALVMMLALVFHTPYAMYAFFAFFLEGPVTHLVYPDSRTAA